MENIAIWVSIFVGVVVPFVVWLINTLITKKIDAIQQQQKEDKELFFKRYDDLKDDMEENYVQQKLYDQAMKFNSEDHDNKIKNLVALFSTQFTNVENKIDDLKDLINDKFNGKKQNGGV